jgi:N-formylglutamate amidohydrolase
LPVVLASPHSGCEYPPDFVNASRLDPVALRQSEDSFVDQLFAAAPQLGVPLLSARFPRAYLDVNREAYELDPAMFSDALPSFVNARSPRVRIGLGTIARVVASGEEIYAKKLRFADAEQRIERFYYPYHHALRRLVEETESLFGGYLLVDCHSMPSTCASGCGQDGADIVLGDCYGASCAPRIVFTTEFYGRPKAHRHALQIEVNRALYMDERSYARKPRFARLSEELAELVGELSQAARECLPKAARERHFD